MVIYGGGVPMEKIVPVDFSTGTKICRNYRQIRPRSGVTPRQFKSRTLVLNGEIFIDFYKLVISLDLFFSFYRSIFKIVSENVETVEHRRAMLVSRSSNRKLFKLMSHYIFVINFQVYANNVGEGGSNFLI